ncbi:MAG: transcription termination factor Rho, partial [Verrucomicrobiota bacterium]
MPNPTNSPASANPDEQAAATSEAPAKDNTIQVSGVLDIDTGKGGNGQLLDLAKNGKRRPSDTFVPKELIRRFKLRQGSTITGTAFPAEGRFPNPKMRFIETVDGIPLEERRAVVEFTQLTTISPEEQIKLELSSNPPLTTRAVDLFCPIGKGTRGLIVAPPRTGKTTLLRDMALGVIGNHPECHVMILLVDERPE